MIATVICVNYSSDLVGFEIKDGDYGYLELFDSIELEIDDEIKGNLNLLGGETIIKCSTQESINVFIEDYGMSYDSMYEMVMKK